MRELWKGFVYFKVYRNEKGDAFDDHGPRYVCFLDNRFIGEYYDSTYAERAFRKGIRDDRPIRITEYLGIPEDVRRTWGGVG